MLGMESEIRFLAEAKKLFKGDPYLLSSFLKPTRFL